jgi:hypothetical protein
MAGDYYERNAQEAAAREFYHNREAEAAQARARAEEAARQQRQEEYARQQREANQFARSGQVSGWGDFPKVSRRTRRQRTSPLVGVALATVFGIGAYWGAGSHAFTAPGIVTYLLVPSLLGYFWRPLVSLGFKLVLLAAVLMVAYFLGLGPHRRPVQSATPIVRPDASAPQSMHKRPVHRIKSATSAQIDAH